jgi:chorismate synthase
MIRFLTSGESHGQQLTAILEGFPAGVKLDIERINLLLQRRQLGYGSSQRMKLENDSVEIVSGVRFSETIGSPITLILKNREWPNWSETMSTFGKANNKKVVTTPRPGHADLPGMIKYCRSDGRDVLERASARETAARCAVGAICNELLRSLNIDIISYVSSIGKIQAKDIPVDLYERKDLAERSPVRSPDLDASIEMVKLIDFAKDKGETLGGIIETLVLNCPVGLGSYVHWDRRLDARISFAMMSIPAIKGVEIGLGFESTRRLGSESLDTISTNFERVTNYAGGIEGGISNGEPIVVRSAMKPLPTLMKPMSTIDMINGEQATASVERSDICAVSRAAVVCEAVMAIEITNALCEKFGGDTFFEIQSRVTTKGN